MCCDGEALFIKIFKEINKLRKYVKEIRLIGVRTCGFSATYLAQFRISLIASMLVSGNAALHANSDKHFTASWNESSVAAKYFSNIFAEI